MVFEIGMKSSGRSRLFLPALGLCLLSIAALVNCGGFGGNGAPDNGSPAGRALELVWPDGVEVDRLTSKLSLRSDIASKASGSSHPSYITNITLQVSGEGFETITETIPLDTLSITVNVTSGTRRFDVVVETNIGITFSGFAVVNIVPGTFPTIFIELTLNAPPNIIDINATFDHNSLTVSLFCDASDPDGDPVSYSWNGPGGWTATGQNVTYNGSNWNASMGTRFTCFASDGQGGFASAFLDQPTDQIGQLAAPTNLTVTQSPTNNGKLNLDWTPSNGANGYRIEWFDGNTSSTNTEDITDGTTTSTTLQCGATAPIDVKIAAVSITGAVGPFSAKVGPVKCPGVLEVTNLTAVDANINVDLTWTNSVNHLGQAATSYTIYYKTASTTVTIGTATGNFFDITGTPATDSVSISCQSPGDIGNNTAYIITASDGTYTSTVSQVAFVTCDGT